MAEANVDAMRRQFAEARLGQVLAFAISIAFLATGAYVAINGQPWVGGILGTMGLSTIVASFITGRTKNHEEPREQEPHGSRPQENPRKRR